MKALVFAAVLLLSWGKVDLPCTRVINPEPIQLSSRNARIVVLLDDKPVGRLRMLVDFFEAHSQHPIMTDSDGIATLKDLPQGTTCLTTTQGDGLSARLCLVVSPQSTNETSSFRMTLAPPPPIQFNPSPDRVRQLEQSSAAVRIRSLKGTVVDPIGAVVPKAEIQVYRRGSYPQQPAKTLKTDDLGRFSDNPDPGSYTVVIQMHGFRPEFLNVEISPSGKDDELRLPLQVATYDDCRTFGND
jgi:hypothetical protein